MELTSDQIKENKMAILRLLISTQRKGIADVIDYLYTTDFFRIPSSLTRHHNWEGGLAQHSLGVYNKAVSLNEGLPEDSIILCSLLHDICKANTLCYDEKGNIQKRKTHIKGHGRRSVKLLDYLGLQLREDERRAIRWHMGGDKAEEDELSDLNLAKDSALWRIIHKADRRDAKKLITSH